VNLNVSQIRLKQRIVSSHSPRGERGKVGRGGWGIGCGRDMEGRGKQGERMGE
jgi:hypothetical protein